MIFNIKRNLENHLYDHLLNIDKYKDDILDDNKHLMSSQVCLEQTSHSLDETRVEDKNTQVLNKTCLTDEEFFRMIAEDKHNNENKNEAQEYFRKMIEIYNDQDMNDIETTTKIMR